MPTPFIAWTVPQTRIQISNWSWPSSETQYAGKCAFCRTNIKFGLTQITWSSRHLLSLMRSENSQRWMSLSKKFPNQLIASTTVHLIGLCSYCLWAPHSRHQHKRKARRTVRVGYRRPTIFCWPQTFNIPQLPCGFNLFCNWLACVAAECARDGKHFQIMHRFNSLLKPQFGSGSKKWIIIALEHRSLFSGVK